MMALVFLGIIPGTSIVITFEMWLIGVATLFCMLLTVVAFKKHVPVIILILWALRSSKHHANLAARLA